MPFTTALNVFLLKLILLRTIDARTNRSAVFEKGHIESEVGKNSVNLTVATSRWFKVPPNG